MWYVVQCAIGREEAMCSSLRSCLPSDLYTDVFVFRYERMKRYEGNWHILNELMFPGYVFIESQHMEGLYKCIKDYPGIVRILGEEDRMTAVYKEEEEFLRKLCREEHFIPMSKGYIRAGVTCVTEGPLTGFEGRIRKIDRHKRIAILPVELCRQKVDIRAGLEIVEKTA